MVVGHCYHNHDNDGRVLTIIVNNGNDVECDGGGGD